MKGVPVKKAHAPAESAPAPQGAVGGKGNGKLVQTEARAKGRIGVLFFINMAAAADSKLLGSFLATMLVAVVCAQVCGRECVDGSV